MNYVYAALLLHSAGKKVDDAALKKVVESTGEKADEAQVKALTAALEGVNIDEALKARPVATSTGETKGEGKEEKEEESVKEEKKEEAAAGLGALFG